MKRKEGEENLHSEKAFHAKKQRFNLLAHITMLEKGSMTIMNLPILSEVVGSIIFCQLDKFGKENGRPRNKERMTNIHCLGECFLELLLHYAITILEASSIVDVLTYYSHGHYLVY